MPRPAPARFDASDRQTLWTSVLGAAGPTLALITLLACYALSGHLCQASNRPWIAALIAGAIGLSTAALLLLARPARASAAQRFLIWLGIALEAFTICVLLTFALTLISEVRCD